PGDPGEGDAVLVEQESLPALVLSHADSDLSLIAQRLSAAGEPAWMRGLNLAALSHPAAIDHYIRSSLASTRLVVVRLLGGRGHWSYGLEQLREWAAQSPQRALLVLGGTADGAEELADLSSEPATTALALASCLRHGGPDNIDAVLLWCQRWLAGAAPSAPEPQPQPDPLCFDWQTDDGPTVGVVAYRALWSSGDTAMLQELAASLRRAGLCPRILLVSGLRD
ncbi:MAG: cobaltochelatase subunit CobN, partial [Synechococcus sp.]